VDALFGAKRGTRAGIELDHLITAIVAYEDRIYRMNPSTGLRALMHLMEANGLTANDLPEIGSRLVVTAILSDNRRLEERHRSAVSRRFAVPIRVFR
jgi:antitoxin component HigA of HigAB toxin-antitoxin module